MTRHPNLRDWGKPMITTIDRGLAWVRRRFAKPLVSGSIPAPVSIIFRPKFNRGWLSRGHRYRIGQAFAEWMLSGGDGSAFWAGFRAGKRPTRFELLGMRRVGMTCPAQRLVEFHTMAIEAMTEAMELRDKNKAFSIEMSRLRRAGNKNKGQE